MAYVVNLPAAARRLLQAARNQMTPDVRGRDVAAYLLGLAAECALKAMAQRFPEARRDDVFYAHLPDLRILLRDVLKGRRGSPLHRLVENDGFLNQWEIKIRYARAEDIRSKPVEEWQQQAVDAVTLMEG